MNNNTSATIGSGADITAVHDVEVNAISHKHLQGFTVGGAGGLVGLSAAVSVWSIGDQITPSFDDEDPNTPQQNALQSDSDNDNENGINGPNADDDAAARTAERRTNLTSELGKLPTGNTGDGKQSYQERVYGIATGASTRLNNDAPAPDDITDSIDAAAKPSGTTAMVGGGTLVSAGNRISVTAHEDVLVDITVGGFAGGFVGAGASVGVFKIAANASAISQGALSAGSTIDVRALLDEDVSLLSLSGGAGLVGLGAAVVVVGDSSVVQASIANVLAATSVDVLADADQMVTVETGQITAGAGAAGASFTRLTADGAVTASVLGGSQIGQVPGSQVGSLHVLADSTLTAHNKTVAIAAGGVAVSANFAVVEATPDVSATIGSGADIAVSGAASVQALAAHDVVADVLTVTSGAGAVGASIAQATLDGTVSATIGGLGTLDAGTVKVEARQNHNGLTPTGKKVSASAAAPTASFGISDTGASATATSSSDVTAIVNGGTLINSGGAVSIQSFSANDASATADGKAFGALAGIGVISTSASAKGTTYALFFGQIDDGTTLNVTADATNTALANGTAAAGGLGGAGNAVSANTFVQPAVDAEITGKVTVTGMVTVLADSTTNATTTANSVALAAGAAFGGGSTASVVAAPHVSALVRNGANINTPSSLTITAQDLATIATTADATAASGGIATGSGIATNTSAGEVTAALRTGTHRVGSVSITATESSTIDSEAFGLAVSGGLSDAGGVATNNVTNSTLAEIFNDVALLGPSVPGGPDAPVPGDVMVHAADTSTISAAVDQTGGGLVAAGEAQVFNHIANHVTARAADHADVISDGNVLITSRSDASILDTVTGVSGGFGAVAGNVAVNSLENDVEAYIQGNSIVNARNNILVQAESENTLGVAAATIAGGVVGVGGTVIVNILHNTTRSFVDELSKVAARGIGTDISIKNWDETSGVEIIESLSGLAVIAHSIERPAEGQNLAGKVVPATILAFNASGGFTGLSAVMTVTTLNDLTEAFIASSDINSAADFGDDVIVRAHSGESLQVYAGGIAGGFVGTGGSVDRTVLNSQTRAFISDNDESGMDSTFAPALVYGRGVDVASISRQSIHIELLGIAGGFFAVAGAVSVVDVTAGNYAFVQDSEVYSQGHLQIVADDTSNIDPTVKSDGGGVVEAGVAISINTIKNTVRSRVTGSQLAATGVLSIRADSDEVISTVVNSDGAGGIALAGSISVNTIETTTEAIVEKSAQPSPSHINQVILPGGGIQSVTIEANDTASIDNNQGIVSAGLFGAGASVEVSAIRNRTVASVGTESKIASKGDVTVDSTSNRTMHTTVIADAGGVAGLAGAVSVLSLGAATHAGAKDEFNKTEKGNPGDSLLTQTNSSAKTQDIADALGDEPLAQTAGSHVNALDEPTVNNALNASPTDKVTAALIADAPSSKQSEIEAGGNVTIAATNNYDVSQTTGTESGGVVAFGAGISLTNIQNTTAASLGNRNTIDAVGDVTVSATDSATAPTTIQSFGGAGGAVALEFNIAEITLKSDTSARVGGLAEIKHGDAVTVEAVQTGQLDATGKGFGGALVAAAGSVKVTPTVTISATAIVEDGAAIGSDGDVAGLTVTASTNETVNTLAQVGHVGGLAGINDGTAETTTNSTVNAHLGIAEVDATGAVQVNASSTAATTSNIESFSGGIVEAGAGTSNVTIAGSVDASVASLADVDAGSLSVNAGNSNTGTSNGDAIGGGVAGGNAAGANATADVDVTAAIGDTDIHTTGPISVATNSTSTATATSGSLGVVGVGEGASVANAKILGDVTASMASGADITSGGLSITATSTSTATADSKVVGVGLVNSNAAVADAQIPGNTLATLGDVDLTSSGDVTVGASSTRSAMASTGQLTVSAGADGGAIAKTSISGAVAGKVLAGATIHASGFNVTPDVFVFANATNTANASAEATSAGFLAGSAAETQATIDVDTRADVDQADVTATGAIRVESHSTSQADATSVGALTVGLIAAEGQAKANAIVEGTTRAFADGTIHSVFDFVRVQAHDENSHAVATTTAAGGGVSFSNQITIAHAHVRPSDDEAEPQVRARLAGDVTAKGDIAARAKSTGANATATSNGFSIAGGAASSGTLAESVLGQTIRSSIGDGSTVSSDGTVKVESINTAGWSTATASAAGGALFAGLTGAKATADAIAQVASAVGNADITAGGTLRVHSDSTNLASATGDGVAIGGVLGKGDVRADATAGKSTVASVNAGAELTLGALLIESIGTDRGISETVGTITGGVAILADDTIEGDAKATANTAGAVAAGESRGTVDLYPTVLAQVGKNARLHAVNPDSDIVINAIANGDAPLGFAPTGDPNTPLTGGDGYSQARADGYSATAFAGNQGGTAKVTTSPIVSVVILTPDANQLPTLEVGGSVELKTRSRVNVDAQTTNGAAGILGEGSGNALAGTDVFDTSEVIVGKDVQIIAGGDLNISANARHVANADADAVAFGAIGLAAGDSYTDIDYATTAIVDDGAHLVAGGTLNVATTTNSSGDADVNATGGGVGALTSANDRAEDDNNATDEEDLEIGKARRGVRIGHATGDTQTTVGNNTSLEANVVNLTATISRSDGHSTATADAAGAGVDSDSLARVELWDDADVTIREGAEVTGTTSVLIQSSIDDLNIGVFASASSSGLFAGATATVIADANTDATVHAEDGALITTHDLVVKALVNGVNVPSLDPNKPDQEKGDLDADRIITFDSDVVFTSGKAVLKVGLGGAVIEQENILFDPVGNDIVLKDIVNDDPGSAWFEANIVPDGPIGLVRSQAMFDAKQAGDPIVHGVGPLFTFRETFDTVYIENLSSKNLVVADINVLNSLVTPKPEVTINAQSLIEDVQKLDDLDFTPVFKEVFGFDVKHVFGPTAVQIRQPLGLSSSNITLTGEIDNPIGTTEILNVAGNIFMSAGNPQADVRTGGLSVSATGDLGNVGTPAERVRIELVGTNTRDVSATDQIWLDVRGLRRTDAFFDLPFIVGSISGSNVDVLLETGIKQTMDPAFTYFIDVEETQSNESTQVENRFRPDAALGSLTVFDPNLFADGDTPVSAAYFLGLIESKGNINIKGALGDIKVHVLATTDLTGSGKIDVDTNGHIGVTEKAGDLQVGLIVSREGNVMLTSDEGNIVDQQLIETLSDAIGNDITLHAPKGGIGSAENPFDIDSSFQAKGEVDANALNDIHLIEARGGDLNVGLVTSETGDVNLATISGGIMDGHDDPEVNIEGMDIALDANGGAFGKIGEANDPLEICATGTVALMADTGPIYAPNVCGDLKLSIATVDIGVLTIFTGGNLELVDGGRVVAPEGVMFEVGGDIAFSPSSEVGAGGVVSITAGTMASTNGAGTKFMLAANITATRLDLFGSPSDDQFLLNHQISRGSPTQVFAGDGNDLIDASALVDRVLAHGGGGNDSIIGGAASDLIWGDEGNDELSGRSGNDALMGGDGTDLILGQEGYDLIIGGLGGDGLNGGPGDDVLVSGNFVKSDDAATIDALLTTWGGPLSPKKRRSQMKRLGMKSGYVVDDRVRDDVVGAEGIDWFWISSPDTSDRQRQEPLR